MEDSFSILRRKDCFFQDQVRPLVLCIPVLPPALNPFSLFQYQGEATPARILNIEKAVWGGVWGGVDGFLLSSVECFQGWISKLIAFAGLDADYFLRY